MKKMLVALAGVCTLGAAALASADPIDDAIEYRQAAFTLVRGNFAPMGAMVKGEVPFDSATFAEHAAKLVALTAMTADGFIEGSDVGDTRAKPEIWDARAKFDTKMEGFRTAVGELAVAAESGDLGVIRPKFGAVAKSCKSCHDDFRTK